MTRDEAKRYAPIVKAYAEGKTIEWNRPCNVGVGWEPIINDVLLLDSEYAYRVKPTPTYRPFANVKECWEEMKKHEPFGWLKSKDVGDYYHLGQVNDELDKEYYFLNFTFSDGSVFGKLTEEE